MESIRRVLIISFLVDVEFDNGLFQTNFEVDVAFFSIILVLGFVQVVQSWFTRFPNPTRSSSLG